MGIDLGVAGIDAELLSSLVAAGVKEYDAKELARMDAFGGASASEWIAGLRAAAALFTGGTVKLDWGTLPTPWESVCPVLMGTDDKAQGLITASMQYGPAIQMAIMNAISLIATTFDKQTEKVKKNPDKNEVQSTAAYLIPLDKNLVKQLQALLQRKGQKDRHRKQAGEVLLEWLVKEGKFIQTPFGEKYYLHRGTHKLLKMDTQGWIAWLYVQTAVNPASAEFKYLTADCETMASQHGEKMDVVRLAHWDVEQEVLRVSRFDGQVYRLDGMTIELEANGDGPVLFEDRSFWLPYAPDFNGEGAALDWTINNLANWESTKEECAFVFRAWWLATFFTELCPTRPILVLKGGKGSGKSMSLRVMLKMLFGPSADVVGVPDKGDDFTALTSNSHIVALDNMDEPNKEIRDRIASLSTGKTDEKRKYYTTNETYYVRYRCWLAVTSRTPDTLQRDDLVDRILILPVCRIDDAERTRESFFLMEVLKKRNAWWGDILTALNMIVREIRKAGVPKRSGLRMEDWAALATVIAATTGQTESWEKGLKGLKSRQTEFLLYDNVILSGIEAWISDPSFTSNPVTTRNLYELSKSALFGTQRPDWSWPQSAKSFGRKLSGMQRELQEHLAEENVLMNTGLVNGNTVYKFEKIIITQGALVPFAAIN